MLFVRRYLKYHIQIYCIQGYVGGERLTTRECQDQVYCYESSIVYQDIGICSQLRKFKFVQSATYCVTPGMCYLQNRNNISCLMKSL